MVVRSVRAGSLIRHLFPERNQFLPKFTEEGKLEMLDNPVVFPTS